MRLLVLGEAFYFGDTNIKEPRRPRRNEADQTKELVIDLAINGPVRNRPFWTKVTKLLLNRTAGEPISAIERSALWHRIAFYNYIQWWMPGGRTKPSQFMWDEAREPFLRTVARLSPDLILVLGLRMQRQLPPLATATLCIPHPSSLGFSYDEWCPRIRRAIASAQKRVG